MIFNCLLTISSLTKYRIKRGPQKSSLKTRQFTQRRGCSDVEDIPHISEALTHVAKFDFREWSEKA